MKTDAQSLSGLYYPFSRCVNEASLKQFLLVFDKLVFVDPVKDEDSRAYLFEELEHTDDPEFRRYRQLHRNFSTLIDEGVVAKVPPSEFANFQSQSTSLAAISDLLDPSWVNVAQAPEKYGMPYGSPAMDGSPTWQVFYPKLPPAFIRALQVTPKLRPHMIGEGDEHSAWTLSYAAGSAAGINVHLAAADELGLAPVTDSSMHHELLLRKLARQTDDVDNDAPIAEDIAEQLVHDVAVSVLSQVMPDSCLKAITLDDVLRFRDETRACRRQFVSDLNDRVSLLSGVPTKDHLVQAAIEIRLSLTKELQDYKAEFGAARDKVWPRTVSAMNTSLATGGVAAVAMSFIGGAAHAIAASILAASLAIMKVSLDLRAETRKIDAKASPAVSYLSKVSSEFN